MPTIKSSPRLQRVANNAVNNAVRDGRMKKPSRCQKCGRKAKLQGHHHDYKKPLDVKFICLRCHAGEKGKAKNSPRGRWRDSNRKK